MYPSHRPFITSIHSPVACQSKGELGTNSSTSASPTSSFACSESYDDPTSMSSVSTRRLFSMKHARPSIALSANFSTNVSRFPQDSKYSRRKDQHAPRMGHQSGRTRENNGYRRCRRETVPEAPSLRTETVARLQPPETDDRTPQVRETRLHAEPRSDSPRWAADRTCR